MWNKEFEDFDILARADSDHRHIYEDNKTTSPSSISRINIQKCVG